MHQSIGTLNIQVECRYGWRVTYKLRLWGRFFGYNWFLNNLSSFRWQIPRYCWGSEWWLRDNILSYKVEMVQIDSILLLLERFRHRYQFTEINSRTHKNIYWRTYNTMSWYEICWQGKIVLKSRSYLTFALPKLLHLMLVVSMVRVSWCEEVKLRVINFIRFNSFLKTWTISGYKAGRLINNIFLSYKSRKDNSNNFS